MKNSEAERLVLENMKLVYYLINKYYPTYTQDEDLQQCGMLALCRAAETWDPDKSQFSTYASKCITNAFNVELRKRSKHYGNLSLDYEYSNGDGEAMTLGDTVVGEEDVEYIDFDRYFKTLSPREKQIESVV